jgi:CheY-like chemotaxis protein
MPIVDGMVSTRMIRECESLSLSERAKGYGRIPIFAVSASLFEKDVQKYIDTGFDGYIMKPIDFKQVNLILGGLQGEQTRRDLIYQPGKWENGGWFDLHDAATPRAEADTKEVS